MATQRSGFRSSSAHPCRMLISSLTFRHGPKQLSSWYHKVQHVRKQQTPTGWRDTRDEAFLISKLERNLKSHLRPFYESKLSQRTSLAWKDTWLLRSAQWLHSPDKADRIYSLCLRSGIWVTPFTLTKPLDAQKMPDTVLRALDSREDKTDVCNPEQETDNEVLYFSFFIQKYQNLALDVT